MSISGLTLPNSEHLSSTRRAYTLSGRLTILHSYGPGIPHFPFGTALHTVCLHWLTSFFDINDKPSSTIMSISGLTLSYSEHLSPTRRAYALSGRLPVLHNYGPGILHFPLSAALYTVCLHWLTSFFDINNKPFTPIMSIA